MDELPAAVVPMAPPGGPLTPEVLRQRLGLDPQEFPDDVILDLLPQVGTQFTSTEQRYEGVPALWMAMADIDERRDAGMLEHYKATVTADQRHQQEIERRDSKAIRIALFLGLIVLALVVGGGIVASALVPNAATPIMSGVGIVAGTLAAPRLIEAWRAPANNAKTDGKPEG